MKKRPKGLIIFPILTIIFCLLMLYGIFIYPGNFDILQTLFTVFWLVSSLGVFRLIELARKGMIICSVYFFIESDCRGSGYFGCFWIL